MSNKQTLEMAGRIRYLTEVELKKAIDNLIEGLTDEEESIIDSSSHNATSAKCIDTLLVMFCWDTSVFSICVVVVCLRGTMSARIYECL